MDWKDWLLIAFIATGIAMGIESCTGGGGYREYGEPTVMFW